VRRLRDVEDGANVSKDVGRVAEIGGACATEGPEDPVSAADVSITPVMRFIGSPPTITPSSTRTSVTYLVMSNPASGSAAASFAGAGTRAHEPPALT
jgi:hypothetical protein